MGDSGGRGTVSRQAPPAKDGLTHVGRCRDTDPKKECAREAAWQRGCGQGPACPANASGHRCSAPLQQWTCPSTDSLPTIPLWQQAGPGGPFPAQRQGAASMRDVRRERSQPSPRDQGTGGALTGGHPPLQGLSRQVQRAAAQVIPLPEGRPPYLLPPDTHGHASVPLWSCLSPQVQGGQAHGQGLSVGLHVGLPHWALEAGLCRATPIAVDCWAHPSPGLPSASKGLGPCESSGDTGPF